MRIALGIEYCGKNYSGWQQQLQAVNSVQAEVEKALAQIANHPVSTICAGRTDTGVHASGQVIHCDVTAVRSEREWVFGCNRVLPDDIRVLWAKQVDEEFHARWSARHRYYKYIIYNDTIRPSLLSDFVAWHYYPLEVKLMDQAAQAWVGEHDFTSFRAAGCQSKSPVRSISKIRAERQGQMIILDVAGNAFLYHMVRNMVGVLLEIGAGKKPVSWAYEVLQAKDRRMAGVTAPAEGLYLTRIDYPQHMQIPCSSGNLWFLKQELIYDMV